MKPETVPAPLIKCAFHRIALTVSVSKKTFKKRAYYKSQGKLVYRYKKVTLPAGTLEYDARLWIVVFEVPDGVSGSSLLGKVVRDKTGKLWKVVSVEQIDKWIIELRNIDPFTAQGNMYLDTEYNFNRFILI